MKDRSDDEVWIRLSPKRHQYRRWTVLRQTNSRTTDSLSRGFSWSQPSAARRDPDEYSFITSTRFTLRDVPSAVGDRSRRSRAASIATGGGGGDQDSRPDRLIYAASETLGAPGPCPRLSAIIDTGPAGAAPAADPITRQAS